MNFIGLTRVMRVGTSNIVYLYKVEMAAVIVHCESVVFTNTNKTIKYHSRFCFPFEWIKCLSLKDMGEKTSCMKKSGQLIDNDKMNNFSKNVILNCYICRKLNYQQVITSLVF